MIDPTYALTIFMGLPILLYLLLSYYYPLWKQALGKGNNMKKQLCIEPEPELCAKCPKNGLECRELENKNKV